MNRPTRREVLAGAAAGALAGCSRTHAPAPLVSIIRAGSYSQDLLDPIRRLVAEHKVDVRGKRVVLKPNLVEFDAGTTINTHPAVVAAALEAFRSLGAAEVRIAEGPGHRRNTLELAEAAGYFQAIPQFEKLFTDLNLDDVARVRVPGARSRMKSYYLPRTALAADLLVSIPKMKCHHWVGATLSMKNLFGLVPGGVYGWPKNVLHWAGIEECIADLHGLFPRTFALVDGIVGMEGNGPIQGTPKAVGAIIGGADPVAVDATCCRIMRIDPTLIPYLQMTEDNGQTGAARVHQIGEPVRAVQTEFRLIPMFGALRLRV
ncbi:MAG: DUF362 domain-containing protein [Bryobacteraceae bacterium]|jgi:uncharacterized protein (DUF362 family)